MRKAVVPVFALPHLAVHEVNKVCSCKKFRDYVARAEESQEDNLSVSISKIEILSIEMFGDKIGFVTMRAYTTNHGFSLPAYVFLRGPAVAILMIVNTKILVVEQYRVPVQQLLLEAPAGMLDESGDFVGTAAKEIEEETSIRLCKDRLLPLGSFYPSPGGCDEEILMFYCELTLP